MATATRKRSKAKAGISILQDHDTAADAKNRISLRGARTKYFHVKALSNGCYVLEPRVLVAPKAVPARSVKRAMGRPKNGLVSKTTQADVISVDDLPKLPPGESFYDQALPVLKKIWARGGRGRQDLATNPKYMKGLGE